MPVEEDEHGLTGGMMAGKGLKYGPAQEFGAEIDAVVAKAVEGLAGGGLERADFGELLAAGLEEYEASQDLFEAAGVDCVLRAGENSFGFVYDFGGDVDGGGGFGNFAQE